MKMRRPTNDIPHPLNEFKQPAAARHTDATRTCGPKWRLLIALSSLPCLMETIYAFSIAHLDYRGLVVGLLFVLASILAALRPTIGEWTLVLLTVIANLLPFMVMSSCLIPVLVALVLIARGRTVPGIMAALTVSVSTIYSISMRRSTELPLGSAIMISGYLLLCAFIGIAWGLKIEKNAREREAARERRRASNLELANDLHNSICNDLAFIIYAASHPQHQDRDTADADHVLREITDAASDALSKVRTTIATLESDTEDEPGSPDTPHDHDTRRAPASNARETARLARQYDHRLTHLGFTGRSIIEIPASLNLPAPVSICIHETLRELYANLLKYADPEGGYFVWVRTVPNAIQITTSNTALPTAPNGDLSSGSGLRRCREKVDSLGGMIRTGLDDEHWTCEITIPF